MTDVSKIKNLIFDFGGVIYEIDHKKTEDAFNLLGITNFEKLFSHAVQSELFEKFETGKISDDQFRKEIKSFIPEGVSEQKIDEAWNLILVGFCADRVKLLKKLKSKYRLYLLSNTNSIHYKIYMREYREKFSGDFNDFFEKAYWSFKIGLRKPDPEIFKLVIEENNLKKDETLFIDDTIKHIESAENSGLSAYWLRPGVSINDIFSEDLEIVLK